MSETNEIINKMSSLIGIKSLVLRGRPENGDDGLLGGGGSAVALADGVKAATQGDTFDNSTKAVSLSVSSIALDLSVFFTFPTCSNSRCDDACSIPLLVPTIGVTPS